MCKFDFGHRHFEYCQGTSKHTYGVASPQKEDGSNCLSGPYEPHDSVTADRSCYPNGGHYSRSLSTFEDSFRKVRILDSKTAVSSKFQYTLRGGYEDKMVQGHNSSLPSIVIVTFDLRLNAMNRHGQ